MNCDGASSGNFYAHKYNTAGIGCSKNKNFVSIQIEPELESKYYNDDGYLLDKIQFLECEVSEINSGACRSSIKNEFLPSKSKIIEAQKKELNTFFSKIKIILGDINLSIEERQQDLQDVSLEIEKHISDLSKLSIKKPRDQGKLLDILTAVGTMSTNLWKALIDTRIINTANFMHTCVPFIISFVPLSLRIAEYGFIQFGNLWRQDLSDILEIFDKLVTAIKLEIRLLDKKPQPSTLINARENCSKQKDQAYSSSLSIEAILQDPIAKRELANRLAAEGININVASEASNSQSALSTPSTFFEGRDMSYV